MPLRSILGRSLIVLTLLACFGQAKAQFQNTDTVHLYSDSFEGFDAFDSADFESDIFISGENHTYLSSNSKMWVKMFKYLYKNAGVRNIMIEYGYSSGYLINEYIQTGDSDIYAVLKKYSFEQHAAAYKELMEFNRDLPDDQKIYLTGIDLERGTRLAAKVMQMMLPDSGMADDSIILHVESLRSLVSYNDNEVYAEDREFFYYDSYSVNNTMKRVIENFIAHEDKYKEYLEPEKFEVFKKIALGLRDLKLWNEFEDENSTHEFVYREMYMFNRFKEEKAKRGGKFYGEFGRCHSAKITQEETSCNWYHFRSLANRIRQWDDNGKHLNVFTMGILYRGDDYDVDGWEGVKEWAEGLFEGMENRRIAIYDFSNDTVNPRMSEMFNLVILNTFNPDDNYPTTRLVKEFSTDNSEDETYKIQYTFGNLPGDFSNVNSTFAIYNSGTGFTDLTNGGPVFAQGFRTSSRSSSGFGSETSYMWSHIYKTGFSDFTVNLSGMQLYSNTYFDILNKSKWLDINLGVGLGYAQYKMVFSKVINPPSLAAGDFSANRDVVFKNPALLVTGVASIEIDVSVFTLGAHYGYQYDVSKDNWRSNGKLRSDTPGTLMTGGFSSYSIGFNF